MIFKIAHICYCGDIDSVAGQLRKHGYGPGLNEKRVEPMHITQSLLSGPASSMSIWMWEKPGCIGVELLDFAQMSAKRGKIVPVLSAPCSPGEARVERSEKVFLGEEEYPCKSFLGFPAYSSGTVDEAGLRFQAFSIGSPCLKDSERFWGMMGFCVVGRSRDLLTMGFRCKFTGTHFKAYVRRCSGAVEHEDIDSPGFHVLGAISNSALSEHGRMVASGANCTPIERLVLGGKALDIFYARTPEGVVAEVISIGGEI